MATRTFALNTTPHTAEIGETTLHFLPEVYGDQFLDAYERLQESQKRLGVDVKDLSGVEPARLRATVRSLRGFLARLMVPESAELFARWVVVKDGETLGVYSDPDEAVERHEAAEGSELRDESLRLPDRVLTELLEWSMELYGGNSGKRPTTSSSDSSPASRPAGTPGKAASRSKG